MQRLPLVFALLACLVLAGDSMVGTVASRSTAGETASNSIPARISECIDAAVDRLKPGMSVREVDEVLAKGTVKKGGVCIGGCGSLERYYHLMGDKQLIVYFTGYARGNVMGFTSPVDPLTPWPRWVGLLDSNRTK